MKKYITTRPLAILSYIIGIAIVVAGILTMALYHDMSWQSYVIIGVIMICAIWAMLNIPTSVFVKQKPVSVKGHNRKREDME